MKLLLIVLTLTCSQACAATDAACLKWALYKEARGEGVLTQRAVLDVIQARMEASKQSACRVLRKAGQFPYMKYGVKKVDFSFTVRYSVVSKMNRVLPKSYLYFNHVKHPWGVNTRKIGGMYFSQ